MASLAPTVHYGREPSWGIVGLYNNPGEPRRVETFIHTFGFQGSKEAIMEVVMAKCRHPDFRNMWRGWRFIPVMVDDAIVIDKNGGMKATRIVKNERLII